MKKITPDPPESLVTSPYASDDAGRLHAAAERALDHYLKPPAMRGSVANKCPSSIFAVVPGLDRESLLAHASETLASVSVMATDLAFELEGSRRQVALAIAQMISLGQLLVNRVLDDVDQPRS